MNTKHENYQKVVSEATKELLEKKRDQQRIFLFVVWVLVYIARSTFLQHIPNISIIMASFTLLMTVIIVTMPWMALISVSESKIEEHIKKTILMRANDIKDHRRSIVELEDELLELDEGDDSDETIADMLETKQEIIEFKQEILNFLQECILLKEVLGIFDCVDDLKKEYTLLDKETDDLIEQHVQLVSRFQM